MLTVPPLKNVVKRVRIATVASATQQTQSLPWLDEAISN